MKVQLHYLLSLISGNYHDFACGQTDGCDYYQYLYAYPINSQQAQPHSHYSCCHFNHSCMTESQPFLSPNQLHQKQWRIQFIRQTRFKLNWTNYTTLLFNVINIYNYHWTVGGLAYVPSCHGIRAIASYLLYTLWVKKPLSFYYTFTNTDQFSGFFYWHTP